VNQDSIVLLDTNVIIEAHRTGCWAQISDFFNLHTVEKVIEETQTGFQNRDPELWIDEGPLKASFAVVAPVSAVDRVNFNMTYGHPSLDDGEKDLMVYAESLDVESIWLLNSPDMAAVRFAHNAGWRDRLVSLESMARRLKIRLHENLSDNYTENWLVDKKTKILLGM
jgi:hypothetical protein